MKLQRKRLGEIWKPVVSFEGLYEVSSLGVVVSLGREETITRVRFGKSDTHIRIRKGGVVCGRLTPKGYHNICLWKEGKPQHTSTHRVVLLAFVGPRPSKRHVGRHLDGNPGNNTPSNLAWGTYKENVEDSIRHGTWVHGETTGNAKLTEEKVRQIRKAPGTQRKVAKEFGVSQTTIWQIKNGNFWKHVYA